MHDGDRVVVLALQRLGERFGRVRLAPGDIEAVGRETAGAGNRVKSLTERAIHEREHPLACGVADGAFHESRRRRRRDVHGTLRPEHALQWGLNARHQLLHPLSTVTHHRLNLRLEDLATYFGGAREKEPAKRIVFGHRCV